MARPSITPDDFIGWVNISANSFKSALLQSYINTFYEQYTRQIIGDAAYLAIESESKQEWTDLMAGVEYTNNEGIQAKYDGLVVSLLKFIYFEFVRDNFTSSQPGKNQPKNENSINLPGGNVAAVARSRYNSAVHAVNLNTTSFLEVFHPVITPLISFTDNGNGTYTFLVGTTKYLLAGDTVVIDGAEYIVTSSPGGAAFVIATGQVGDTFTGPVSWDPYEEVDFTYQKPAVV